MIPIQIGKPPAIFNRPLFKQLRQEAEEFFSRNEKTRRQQKFRFKVPYLGRLRSELSRRFHRKCAYCESPISSAQKLDINWFRPKVNAVAGGRGKVSPDHYWWLACEWTNLRASCVRCNRAKKNHFPVKGQRDDYRSFLAGESKEVPLLIDPCVDEPAEHIGFELDGPPIVYPLSKRGEVTIDILELNRSPLLSIRRRELLQVRGEFKRVLEKRSISSVRNSIINIIRPDHPFAGLRRQRVARYLENNRPFLEGICKLVSFRRRLLGVLGPYFELPELLQEPAKGKRDPVGKTAAIKRKKKARTKRLRAVETITRRVTTESQMLRSIEIKNFKGIGHLKIEFDLTAGGSNASWLTLLGENGCGKTSVLQAVALAIMPKERRGTGKGGVEMPASRVLRRRSKRGFIRLGLSGGGDPIELEFNGRTYFRASNPYKHPLPRVLGYGPTRLLPHGHHRVPARKPRVHVPTLFDPFVPLIHAEQWLMRTKKNVFEYAARTLKDILFLPDDARFERSARGGLVIRMGKDRMRLDELSAGYQATIALATDIMSVVSKQEEVVESAEGLVMIDEIGVHLHPRWRMRVVEALRRAFPQMQFLCTTHEPLCLRGHGDNEIVVMTRNAREQLVAVKDLPDITGMRVDQILTSQYFGLHTAMDPEIEQKFIKYYGLLALHKPSAKDQKAIQDLEKELEGKEFLGNTERERLLYRLIDEFLARREPAASEKERAALVQSSNERLLKIWGEV